MSRQTPRPGKPFASNDRPVVMKAGLDVLVTHCGGCRFWQNQALQERDLLPDLSPLGFCTVRPPSVGASPTMIGQLQSYPVTKQGTPACGLAEPKPDAPAG